MKFKPLKWTKHDYWIAYTPAARFGDISIAYEEGLYWASWDLTLPGTKDLEELKRKGQEFHENYLKQFFEE